MAPEDHAESSLDGVPTVTALHSAAARRDSAAVAALLSSSDKEAEDGCGATPFHYAARGGDTGIMEILMVHVEKANKDGLRALHYAAWNGHKSAVWWLIHKQADVNANDGAGNTALHWAARKGSSEVIESLIRNGANVCATNNKGELPVGLAAEYHQDAAVQAIFVSWMSNAKRAKQALSNVNPMETHKPNSATLLHYCAGYCTEMEPLKWFVSFLPAGSVKLNVNAKDKHGRAPIHWAAMKGNKAVVNLLASLGADLHDDIPVSPLSLALIHKDLGCAEELLKCASHNIETDWNWTRDMENFYNNSSMALGLLHKDLIDGLLDVNLMFNWAEFPPIYLALHAQREDIAKLIQRHTGGVENAVNKKGPQTGRTALHWATILRKKEIVMKLCRTRELEQELTPNEEDAYGKMALQYATEMELPEIERVLMQREDVRSYMDKLYRDRQVYVDAANAILVGAALIAGLTVTGWLQPPQRYTLSGGYESSGLPLPLPYLAVQKLYTPWNSLQPFSPVEQHMAVRLFWTFNSLSFFFAIATVIAGLVAVMPMPAMYIACIVTYLHRTLILASLFLAGSIIFVLAAFAAAGFVVLPPILQYQANMIRILILGSILCIMLLAWLFLRLLYVLKPRWFKAIELFRRRSSRAQAALRNSAPTLVSALPDDTSTPLEFQVGERYKAEPWDDGLDRIHAPDP